MGLHSFDAVCDKTLDGPYLVAAEGAAGHKVEEHRGGGLPLLLGKEAVFGYDYLHP